MPVKTEHTFEAVSANYDKSIRYSSIIKGVSEGKIPVDYARNAAREIISEDPNYKNREPQRQEALENIAQSPHAEELIDYVDGGRHLYEHFIGEQFKTGLVRIVESTPDDVMDELVKALSSVKPKDNVPAGYERAREVHIDYYDFIENMQKLQDGSASEVDREKAQNKIAELMTKKYDDIYMEDGVVKPGYEKLYQASRDWTLKSKVKFELSLKNYQKSLVSEFESAVNTNSRDYLLNCVGKKIIRKMYDKHFQNKDQKEEEYRQKRKQYADENDIEIDKKSNLIFKTKKEKKAYEREEELMNAA